MGAVKQIDEKSDGQMAATLVMYEDAILVVVGYYTTTITITQEEARTLARLITQLLEAHDELG